MTGCGVGVCVQDNTNGASRAILGMLRDLGCEKAATVKALDLSDAGTVRADAVVAWLASRPFTARNVLRNSFTPDELARLQRLKESGGLLSRQQLSSGRLERQARRAPLQLDVEQLTAQTEALRARKAALTAQAAVLQRLVAQRREARPPAPAAAERAQDDSAAAAAGQLDTALRDLDAVTTQFIAQSAERAARSSSPHASGRVWWLSRCDLTPYLNADKDHLAAVMKVGRRVGMQWSRCTALLYCSCCVTPCCRGRCSGWSSSSATALPRFVPP